MMRITAILLLLGAQNLTVPGPAYSSPEVWKTIQEHCVAVVTEAHEEKRPLMSIGGPMWPIVNGEEIVQVPEKTLKLRCK